MLKIITANGDIVLLGAPTTIRCRGAGAAQRLRAYAYPAGMSDPATRVPIDLAEGLEPWECTELRRRLAERLRHGSNYIDMRALAEEVTG